MSLYQCHCKIGFLTLFIYLFWWSKHFTKTKVPVPQKSQCSCGCSAWAPIFHLFIYKLWALGDSAPNTSRYPTRTHFSENVIYIKMSIGLFRLSYLLSLHLLPVCAIPHSPVSSCSCTQPLHCLAPREREDREGRSCLGNPELLTAIPAAPCPPRQELFQQGK